MAYPNKAQYAAMKIRAAAAEERLQQVLRDLDKVYDDLGEIEHALGCKSEFRAIGVNWIRNAVMAAIVQGRKHGRNKGAGFGYYRGPTSEGGDRTGRIAEEIA